MSQNFVYSKTWDIKGVNGLQNLGNTCYINAVVQSLLSCENFTEFLSNESLWHFFSSDSTTDLANSLRELHHGIRESSEAYWPQDFLCVVAQHWKEYVSMAQADAEEFLIFLLRSLHKDLKVRQREATCSQDPSEVHVQVLACEAWLTQSRSAISLIAHTQIMTLFKCSVCSAENVAVEDAANHLSINLTYQTKETSLMDCLEEYFCEQFRVDYKCETCDVVGAVRFRTVLGRIPPVLIIHLKRFQQLTGYGGMVLSKNNTEVSIPLQIDLTKFLIDDLHSNAKYALVAVTNHSGTLQGGHYTAVCQRNKRWYKFDDSKVSSSTTRGISSNAAYLLWYERPLEQERVLPMDMTSLVEAATQEPHALQDPVTPPNSPDPKIDHVGNFGQDTENSPLSPDMDLKANEVPEQPLDKPQQHSESTDQDPEIDNLENLGQGKEDSPLLSDLKATEVPEQPVEKPQKHFESTDSNNLGKALNPAQKPHCKHPEYDLDKDDPVLEEEDVPGAFLRLDLLEKYKKEYLQRWLKCRGLLVAGKKAELVKRINDAVSCGKRHKIDSSIDKGVWHLEKKRKLALTNAQDPRGYLPLVPMGKTVWQSFPSCHIPNTFTYEKLEAYISAIPEVAFNSKTGVYVKDEVEEVEEVDEVDEYASDDALLECNDENSDKRLKKFMLNSIKRGKAFLESGRILTMEDTAKDSHYFVKADVNASMKRRIHKVVVTFNKEHGEICNGSCNCKAAALGRCCHVTAVLLLILTHIENHGNEAVTTTGRPCYWAPGKNSAKRNPGVIRQKGEYYPKVDFERRSQFSPIPSAFSHPTDEEKQAMIQRFRQSLKKLPTKVLWSYHLNQKFEGEEAFDDPDDLNEFTEHIPDPETISEVVEQCNYLMWNLNHIRKGASRKRPHELSRTTAQFASSFWHSERSVRVPASKAKDFLGLAKDSAKINFLRKHMWGLDKFQNDDMAKGIEKEPIARDLYRQFIQASDPEAFVLETGSWVLPEYPQLLCSPDGLVFTSSLDEDSMKLFETKYANVLDGHKPNDFDQVLSKGQQNGFYLRRDESGNLKLKETHRYYYQVQQSLDILQLQTCDFMVLSGEGTEESPHYFEVIQVKYNESFWKEKRERIIAKHREFMVPEYFLYRTVRKQVPWEMVYPKNHEEHTDPYFLNGCESQDFDENISEQ